MTEEELKAGETLLAAAKPSWIQEVRGDSVVGPNGQSLADTAVDRGASTRSALTDAAAIAWAVNNAPAMIAKIQKLRNAVEITRRYLPEECGVDA